ncbi:MAG: zinc ribbon domain-containing protein, partial [Deltaproteobacteria bacterium]|nr:zinc ribbon domain-containing protein [Deltaproteobacteria bacterium]
MQCPECQFENPEGTKFCGECGAKLERLCSNCNSLSPPNFKFCGECGHRLLPADDIFKQKSDSENLPTPSSRKELSSDIAPVAGERKHVTVLFSDMSGYTSMSERLDPEEVKDLVWDSNCGINLANYLTNRQEKIGIIAKGCDSRNIVNHIIENKIKRDQ